MALFNVKVPSIGKIEIEIENGENVIRRSHIEVCISIVVASRLASHAASNNTPV